MTQPFYERWLRWSALDPATLRGEIDSLFPDRIVRLPHRWNEVGFGAAVQPLVGVCWYEALAYCAWLVAQTGQSFRLPSEVEWEGAARGPEGRGYAWGNTFDLEYCNSVETHVRRTTPIGAFPMGRTPGGLTDMTGNVFEWTSSAADLRSGAGAHIGIGQSYSDNLRKASERRVVRGGSWGQDQHRLLCARRIGELPAAVGDNLGFRLALQIP